MYDRLNDLLEQWEEAASQGIDLSAAELCSREPYLAPELDKHIKTLRWMRRALLDMGEPTGPIGRR